MSASYKLPRTFAGAVAWTLGLVALAWAGPAEAGGAKNQIRSLSHDSVPWSANARGPTPGTTTLRITGTRTPTFTVYKLEQPPRVVIDVANATLSPRLAGAEGKATWSVGSWSVGQVAAHPLQGTGRSVVRVVVGLPRVATYQVAADGSDLVVTVTPEDAAPRTINAADAARAVDEARREAVAELERAARSTRNQAAAAKRSAASSEAEAERARRAAARARAEAERASSELARAQAEVERVRRTQAGSKAEIKRARQAAQAARAEAEALRRAAAERETEAERAREQSARHAAAVARTRRAAKAARAEVEEARQAAAAAQGEAARMKKIAASARADAAASRKMAAASQAEADRARRQAAQQVAEAERVKQAASHAIEESERARQQAEAAVTAARAEVEGARARAEERVREADARMARAAQMMKSAERELEQARSAEREAQAAKRSADQARAQAKEREQRAARSEAQARKRVAEAERADAAARRYRAEAASQGDRARAAALQKRAEKAAADAERRRAAAEAATSTAERSRSEAEAAARAAEKRQQEALAALREAESQRSDAEKARADAEARRVAVESQRKQAEKRRSEAEAAAREAADRAERARALRQREEAALAKIVKARQADQERARAADAAGTRLAEAARAASEAESRAAKTRRAADEARREAASVARRKHANQREVAEREAAARRLAAELDRAEKDARARRAEAARHKKEVAALEAARGRTAAELGKLQKAAADARAEREREEARLAELTARRAEAEKKLAQAERAGAKTREDRAEAPLARASAARQPAGKAPTRVTARVRELDFSDRKQVARVVIDMTGAAEPRVVTASGKRAILEIPGAELPPALQRTLDTSRFRGPVKAVASYRDPGDPGVTRVVVDLDREVQSALKRSGSTYYWDFAKSGASSDSQAAAARAPRGQGDAGAQARAQSPLVVGGFGAASTPITQKSVAQLSPRQRKVYRGTKIDLDFKDADIHNLLRLLADVGGVNIVIPDEIQARVTVRLRRVPWDQALEVILASKGLWYRREGNLYRIAPRKQLDTEDEAEAQRIANLVKSEVPEPEVFTLNYSVAKDVRAQLAPLLSPKGRIEVDDRTNSLIINDIRAHRRRIIDLLTRLDTQTPQVQIEARIVEARSSFSREIGVQWGGSALAGRDGGNATGLIFPNSIGVRGGSEDNQTNAGGVVLPSDFAVNLPAAVGSGAGGAIGVSLGSVGGNFNLNLRLSALEDSGSVRIISAPKITVVNNVKAEISQGVSIPISVISANGVQTQFVPADLSLRVTPHVSQRDCSIQMELEVSKNEADFANTGARGDPSILRKEARTTILVADAETTVIGGIYTRNTGLAYSKVPFFGDLPVLGWFFKTRRENDERTEVLIFITPKITNKAFLRCE